MRTTRRRLTRATLADQRPDLAKDLPDGGLGIVHLGLGAFHRAHQAVLTQQAMRNVGGDWSICAVAQRSPAVRNAMHSQDNLFTVAERSATDELLTVVGSVREVLLATQQPDRLTALLAAEHVHVVTITVTEAGYRHDPATGLLRATDPDVAADLAGGPPRTVIGQLVRGLRARRASDAGLTVISCDNLPDNGRLVRRLVHDFCGRLRDRALSDWVERRVAFPNSVVDQIVPAATPSDLREVAEGLGLVDHAAVVGEPYRQWVIEDRFAGPRPAWESAGARIVPDVARHQLTKLRVLNGTHSAIAYLGMLAGFESTAETVTRPQFAGYVARLVREETGRGLDADPNALLTRLANPRITHRLAQIGADGAHKLPQRLLAPAEELLAVGGEPRLICLALAAFVRHEGASSLAEVLAVPEALRESRVFRGLMVDAFARLDRDGALGAVGRV